jgi:O-antigen/teichoic acid export membrane protein
MNHGRPFKQWLRHARGNTILRSIGGIGGAAMLSQGLALASSPLLTRLFNDAQFGELTAFIAVGNIATTCVLLGLNEAVIAAREDGAARALFGAGCISILIIGPVASIVAFGLVQARLFGLGVLSMPLALSLLPYIVVLGLFSLFQGMLIREQRFAPIGQAYLGLGGARAGLQVLLGWLGSSATGLILGELAGRVLAVGLMLAALRPQLRGAIGLPGRDKLAAVSEYRNFPLFRTPSALATALATGLPTLIVASRYGADAVGQFGLMTTVLLAPVALVQKAVGDVFLGHYAAQLRAGSDQATTLFWRTAGALGALALVFTLTLYIAGPQLFAIVFGTTWRLAGELAATAAPWIGLSILVQPLSTVLIAANRPATKFVFDVLYLSAVGAAWWLGSHGSRDLRSFVHDLTYLISLALIVYFMMIVRANRRASLRLGLCR